MSEQFALSKTLDIGVSNACIEYIFESCEDLIDGRAICGAGGGGFLVVIMKNGVTRDMLNERLKGAFGDLGVEVWDSEFV